MMKKDFAKLMRGINSNMNSYIGKNVEKYGIKQGQIDYFLLISQTPGINQIEIAKFKNVGKTSVTKAIKILEADGLVKREVDESDRRNVQCFVTEKGKQHVAELMNVKKSVEKDIFAGFNEEELTSFYDYLTRLYNNSERLKNDTVKAL